MTQDDTELTRLRQVNARLEAALTRQRQGEASQAAEREALQQVERRLRDTLESIDEGFLLIDRDWSVIDLNLQVVRTDGRPAAQLVGRSIFSLWPELAGTEAEAVLRRSMIAREPARLQHRLRRDGADRTLELRVFPSGRGLSLFFRDVTGQQAARQRLHRAETNARLALAAARLGTWSYEPQNGALAWDDRHREMFGLQPGAPTSYATLLAGIHPEDRARIDAEVRAATDPAGSGEIVTEYRSIDAVSGRERWLAASGQAQFEGGLCSRFDGVVQDITERRRTEAALAESEARFRAIAEASPGIVFVTDAAGLNTYVNPQFADYTGLPAGTLLGAGWLDVVHPEDRPHSAAQWHAAVRSGGSYQVEQRLRRHDGAWRWFLCRGVPMREAATPADPHGRIAQWFGTGTDIEAMVEARQVLARDRDALETLVAARTAALSATLGRLRQEEARMGALFRQSSECLILLRVEADGALVYADVNPLAEALMGRPRAELIGRTPRSIAAGAAEAADMEQHLAAALRPGTGPYRYTARRSWGGTERVLDVVAVALDGPERERLLLITARDMTERLALEEALRQSQKMEAVGQLTGGIAHDFNNMLAGISGSLELMRARVAEGRAAEVDRYAGAALDSVRRAAALTHRLLAFSRRQALDPKPVDLNRLVAGMEELIRRTIGPAITLETTPATDPCPTLCDANQLESALLNLCLNARDAMPEGGTLRIATAHMAFATLPDPAFAEAERRDGACVAVTVTDSGGGMAPEVAARAFEPFFTTKPIGQGTGLGLSMAYGFARQSGGQIRLHSVPGHGTTVRIELPRHDGAIPDATPPAEHPTDAIAPGAAILVVEDEPLVRSLAVEALGELGYRTLAAGDAAAALGLLQDGAEVDLLLTDIGLPGMNGRQLARAARALRPALKVLFITGYAHPSGDEVGALGAGTALLAKPFALEALAGKVRAMLAA